MTFFGPRLDTTPTGADAMHAPKLLYKLLCESCEPIHRARLNALAAVVGGLLNAQRLSIVAIGRGITSAAAARHRIKQADRLIGNVHLSQERGRCYAMLCRWVLSGLFRPIIVVDWSPLQKNRSWHVLRAALAVKGRTITLYEEVHPESSLGSRRVHQRFLRRMAEYVPVECTPVVVTDAGFGQPWFRAVEALGWHWIGRLRGKVYLAWQTRPDAWVCLRALYERATRRAAKLGLAQVVRSHPIRACIVAFRAPHKGRHRNTAFGERARSKHSRYQAHRQREPWMLAASPELASQCTARQLVAIYRARMQIEEAFRDIKSLAYGYGGITSRTPGDPDRMANLLLVAALAAFLQWCIGLEAQRNRRNRIYQTSTRTARPVLSVIYLAALIIRNNGAPRLTRRSIDTGRAQIRQLNEWLWD